MKHLTPREDSPAIVVRRPRGTLITEYLTVPQPAGVAADWSRRRLRARVFSLADATVIASAIPRAFPLLAASGAAVPVSDQVERGRKQLEALRLA